MTSKPQARRAAKLKRSFVLTFSAVAAGMGGCDDSGDQCCINPPYSSGGYGGGSSGSAGGDPPFVPLECPSDVPPHGGTCDASRVPLSCAYDHHGNPCTEVLDYTRAVCEQSKWVVDIIVTTCNPPDIDGGASDDDAGR